MTTTKKAIIFFVVLFVIIWAALFGVIHSTRVMAPNDDTSKEIDGLRTSLTTLDANVRILTETLTKYEEELKLCRARPFCQDRVVETLEKQAVPSHPASDEVDNANP